MELVSIGYIQNTAILKYGKFPSVREKINEYFSQFLDNYQDLQYVWYEDRVYVGGEHIPTIVDDLERTLNKPIDVVRPKSFPEEYTFRFYNAAKIKQKLEKRALKKKKEKDEKRNKIIGEFDAVITNLKASADGFKTVGCFDLEFWEQDMNRILEFGWKIEDFSGTSKTTHLIVRDNIECKNGFYSKNNRFSRNDSEIVSLAVAMERFQTEFLGKFDVLVGHALCNDFKVLKLNDLHCEQPYYDTADIAAALMNKDNKMSLEKLLKHYNVSYVDLHNAANDVESTMAVFLRMGKMQ